MSTRTEAFHTFDHLREFVNRILCHHDQLEIGAFHMSERLLVRGNKPCGIFFCLHGPRSVKFTAIWDMQRNAILFYGSTGERFHKVQLVRSPQLSLALA
jgi:hypothetical protein